ncbi:hypothetical protein ILUMI_13526 [Ignelater luminosus]|uniref:RNA-directed DNA polymerase n=1 Tax=Ignelater luminosus TaxID=2038154 RepID=A0A8K0G8K7_IGNLU|nr:hypothetical protein ILUMI_13526 [Ignelater luminosus]
MFKPPRSLTFDRSAYTNLEDFLRNFNIYLKATGLDAKDDESKIAIFLQHAGKEAQRKFQIFKLTEENRKKYDSVIKAFKDYWKLMKNETYDRYKFFSRNQQVGESFDDFLTDIKLLAMDCNFGTLEESLLRDKIVHGILDAVPKESLLQQSNLSCKKAEKICIAAEVSHYQIKELDNGSGKEVDVVYTTKTGTKPKSALKDGGLLYHCFKCGRKHGFDVNNIINDDLSIITYGKNKIKTKGTVVIECIIKWARYNIKFLLIEQAKIPILGLNACTKLQLLKKVDSVGLSFTNKGEFVAKNKEVFEGTGRYMFTADLLSRSFIKTDTKHSEQTIVVHTLDIELPISDNSLNDLKNATNSDPVLTQVKDFCNSGWPGKCKKFSNTELSAFFKLQDSLFVKDDLIFLQNKLVVPKAFRNSMLKKLHIAHFGIEKTKARARKIFYWPGLNLSPAKLLCKRMLRTTLPVSSNILNKEPHINLEQLNTKRLKAKKYYDQHSQHRDVFKVVDSVLLQKEKGKQWVPGEISIAEKFIFLKKRLSNTTAHWRAIDFDFDDTGEPSPSVSSVPEVSINGNSSVPQITRTGRVINKPVRYRN